VRACIGVALAAACGDDAERDTRVCTAVDCVDGLNISIPGRSVNVPPTLAEGRYALQLVYDGTVVVCQNDWSRTDLAFSCADPSSNSAAFELGGPDQSPVRVLARIEGRAPEFVDVALLLDGVSIALSHTVPRYRVLYPNGIECGGPCRQGSIEAEIDTRPLTE
jgi:hypothetical protein